MTISLRIFYFNYHGNSFLHHDSLNPINSNDKCILAPSKNEPNNIFCEFCEFIISLPVKSVYIIELNIIYNYYFIYQIISHLFILYIYILNIN